MQFKALAVAAAASTVTAQNSSTPSFCDKYTTALFMNNTADNQLTLVTAVVNTAVIGNYSESKTGKAVAGILAPGTYNGAEVNLLPYFNGGLKSTNRGGSEGVSVNFLDDGGAAPLMMGKAADGTSSMQYMLLTHLYEYFGALLGCSGSTYPAYEGDASQYEVHKFMVLDPNEMGYFITQVADAAASFGVSADDLTPVGAALNMLFNVRLAPPTTVIPAQGPQLQSMCTDESCPKAENSTTEGQNVVYAAPVAVNATMTNSNMTMSGGSSSTSMTTGGSGSQSTSTRPAGASGTAAAGAGSTTGTAGGASATPSTAGAAALSVSFIAVVGGLAAFFM